MSLYSSNDRPLCIILCKIQDLKVGTQEHKTPILSLFYHFEVLCFHTQTQLHINFSFHFGRPYRKEQEKGYIDVFLCLSLKIQHFEMVKKAENWGFVLLNPNFEIL